MLKAKTFFYLFFRETVSLIIENLTLLTENQFKCISEHITIEMQVR